MASGGHRPGPVLVFHPSQACLAVQMHMFGAKCGPPGGKPCVGGQWSPVLNSVRVGGP